MRKLHLNPVGWSAMTELKLGEMYKVVLQKLFGWMAAGGGIWCLGSAVCWPGQRWDSSRQDTSACSCGHSAALMVQGNLSAQWPLPAVCAPGCLLRVTGREQLLRQLLSQRVGLILDVLLSCWCQLYLPRSAQHRVLWGFLVGDCHLTQNHGQCFCPPP